MSTSKQEIDELLGTIGKLNTQLHEKDGAQKIKTYIRQLEARVRQLEARVKEFETGR